MQQIIIVHHHEIILKGDNRKFFERQLLRNIQRALAGLISPTAVTGGYGKFFIFLRSDEHPDEVMGRLSKVFGIANICSGVKIDQDVGEMCSTAELLLKDPKFTTLKRDNRRPD